MTDVARHGDLIPYETRTGKVRIDVTYEDETFWLSQLEMAQLLGVEVPTINHHLKEIFESGELLEAATIRKLRIVRIVGNRSVSREIGRCNSCAAVSWQLGPIGASRATTEVVAEGARA